MNADERGCGQEERTAKSAKDAKGGPEKQPPMDAEAEKDSWPQWPLSDSAESRIQRPEFRVADRKP